MNRAFGVLMDFRRRKWGGPRVSMGPGICAQKGASDPTVPERADKRHNHVTAKPDPPLPLGLSPKSAHGAAAPCFLGDRSQNLCREATACTTLRTAFGVAGALRCARSLFWVLSSLSLG